ncbi:MFS transporter [Arthrobacter sp. zg-Y411]|uniref:MFS transporter n=1 Tax=Arthrobacter TaxID=1663 RepID=UPI001D1543F5|nr:MULTISPECIES: MFS transporter [Arthrobacter]MCC3295692.1 MFS transporter [Arthrobacter zhangbolii]MDN3905908.1 MFS transporter [Arthrobacter sp. YD2]
MEDTQFSAGPAPHPLWVVPHWGHESPRRVQPASSIRPGPHVWSFMKPAGKAVVALIACCIAQFVLTVNGSIVSIVLPDIAKEFGSSMTMLQWTVGVYVLAFACLLTAAGNMADRLGRRRILLAGLAVILIGSVVCALSPDVVVLIVGRVVQAVGAAMLASSGLAAVSARSSDTAVRVRAIAWWAAIGGVALAAGPFIGGVVSEFFGWRGVFWMSVPVALIGLALVPIAVRESRNPSPLPFDVVGQLLVSGFLAALAFAMIEGTQLGWTSAPILISLGAAAVLLIVWLLRARRRPDPLIPLRLFADRPFVRASLTSIIGFAAAAGFFYIAPQYLRSIRGESALEAGIFLLPLAIAALVSAQLSGRIVAAGRAGQDLVAGGGIMALGSVMLLLWSDGSLWVEAASFVVFGFGYGLLNDPLSVEELAALPDSEAGLASSLFSTSKQTGQLLGIAVVGTILSAASADFANAYRHVGGWVWMALLVCSIAVAALNIPSLGTRTKTAQARTTTAPDNRPRTS